MKLKVLFALIILTAATQSQAKWLGGHDGNGGGGFCNQGVCKTAAEAGIQIKGDSQTPGYWILPGDVIQQVEGIISALPFGQTYLKTKTFATPSTFVLAESFNWNAMRRIKNDYKEVMAKNNFAKPSGELEIFAISDSRYTYLLPSFFKLNSRQKALILIHEGNIRAGHSLEKALEFDSLLQSYLFDHQGKSFDLPRFLGSLQGSLDAIYNITGNIERKTFSILVDYIQRQSGKNLTLANFLDTNIDYVYNLMSIEKNGRIAVAKSAAVFGPQFSKIFASGQIWFNGGYEPRVSKDGALNYYQIEAATICESVEHQSALEQWPLVVIQSTVFAVKCNDRNKDGTYPALEFTISKVNFGNIQD